MPERLPSRIATKGRSSGMRASHVRPDYCIFPSKKEKTPAHSGFFVVEKIPGQNFCANWQDFVGRRASVFDRLVIENLGSSVYLFSCQCDIAQAKIAHRRLKALRIRVCQTCDDLVAAITLMENAPVEISLHLIT